MTFGLSRACSNLLLLKAYSSLASETRPTAIKDLGRSSLKAWADFHMGSSLNWGTPFRVLFIRAPYYIGDPKRDPNFRGLPASSGFSGFRPSGLSLISTQLSPKSC